MHTSFTAAALAAFAVGQAVAGPTHAHLRHRHAHEKRGVDWSKLDWDSFGINWASAYAEGIAKESATAEAAAASSTVTPTPTSTAAEVVAAAVTSSAAAATTSAASLEDAVDDVASAVESAASAVESAVASLWHDLVGYSNNRTSFGEATTASGSMGDDYEGNYGNPYGSNVIKVDSRDGYDYTNEFINTSDEAMTVVIWNKVGSDGQTLSGSCLAPTDPALTFVLEKGASQIVAFQENSQVGWAQACDDTTSSGAFATTWGEAQLRSDGSGYDMSAIENPNGNNYNMTISSTEADCISDMTQNYWLTATEPIGDSDGSCYISQSTATLTTLMGGTVSS